MKAKDEGGGMKDEGVTNGSAINRGRFLFILHPSAFILSSYDS